MLGFVDFSPQRGQALLIIVLIMVVALTVGLSVATRSITSLRTSTEEANSAQALSAAEAGLERSLSTGASIASEALPESLPNQSSYFTSVTTKSGSQILLNNGTIIPRDEGIDLWFVAHTCGSDGKSPCWGAPWSPSPLVGTINVYWDTNSCNNSAAVEIAVVSGNSASPVLTRYVYDPCSDRRVGGTNPNNFSAAQAGGQIEGKTLNYSTGSISITDGLIARIIPIYKDTVIGVDASSALPSQGSVITATGSLGAGNSKIVRKLTAFQAYPSLPAEYFTFGIFSPSN
ncbi:MAG: pilus assembly PilX N-terminal domain-containing protein [Candidatus Levybacteria bacterium]|nr:pilus assembly PilX N-terminal domain-containing protein [Candidatus Levybacteria bacterium]